MELLHPHFSTRVGISFWNLCQRSVAYLSVIVALGEITNFRCTTMQSEPLKSDISVQAPIFASIISPWIYQSACRVSVPTNGTQSNYHQGNLTWKWKKREKKIQITTNAGYFWRGHWLYQFSECNDACQNSNKSLQIEAVSQLCWSIWGALCCDT